MPFNTNDVGVGDEVPPVVTGLPAQISIGSQSTTGPGGTLDGGACRSNHTMVVSSSAGVSAGSVQLEGSLDGLSWFNMGAAVSTITASTTFAPVVVSNQPVRFLRARVATAITGGTISALVASS
jgi:hypothetical protein